MVAYTHGHHESVLRSHLWRTAANSTAYLLPSLERHLHILDVGCGPGALTVDLATLVPDGHVTGLENAPKVLEQARALAAQRGVDNVTFATGDALALDYPDATFDVVHAHQVLQHVGDPIRALREMRRVTKPGGIVAVRAVDFPAMTWYPDVEGLSQWRDLYIRVARANGGEPESGRRLLSWALQAGFSRDSITATAGNWCYSTPQEPFADSAVGGGYATPEDVKRIATAFREWGAQDDAWFGVLHGEIIARV